MHSALCVCVCVHSTVLEVQLCIRRMPLGDTGIWGICGELMPAIAYVCTQSYGGYPCPRQNAERAGVIE